ncbi:MAG: tRNA uridine(34) 5-carboxymethylaminomethyl modification radical SAM/GNAT enzyme Elp3 [Candidatus Bathyarchaeia archaeon]
MPHLEEVCLQILKRLNSLPNPTRKELEKIRLEVCRELGSDKIPGNAELIKFLSPSQEGLLRLLVRRRVRTSSGICVVAVMTKPFPCPLSEPCIYCPGGPKKGVPQSYTGHEPAAMRGVQNRFSPYRQVKSRLKQLVAIGHRVDKVELIILGGTFTAMPPWYQRWFIKRCLDALSGEDSKSLKEAKMKASKASIKNSGITIETRPDWCRRRHVDRLLYLGVTRVELGVQTIYDDIYEFVGRGHKVKEVIQATRTARDAGLSLCYHLMLNLPGSNPERDFEMFIKVFEDPAFRPDAIKVYPCLILAGTKLYDLWLKGSYKPYDLETLLDLLSKAFSLVPPYVRVQRVQRDIPRPLIEAGCIKGNLRELVEKRMFKQGLRCRCIRCREVGLLGLKDSISLREEDLRLLRQEYEASDGLEFFLSFEEPTKDILVAYLRLRKPSEKVWRRELSNAAVVRELHVCGPMVPVGHKSEDGWQHKGYGKRLLKEAEAIASNELGCRRIAVLSALGVREYYRRQGYRLEGAYMVKDLC